MNRKIILRTYVTYDNDKVIAIDVKVIEKYDLWAELAYLFIEHDKRAMLILFKKGIDQSEMVVVINKVDRREV